MTDISSILQNLASEQRLRTIPSGESAGLIDLSSNDYLSLATRQEEFIPEFLERFYDASFSSSASRLLSMKQRYHLMLEDYLSSLYKKEVLLFNSGYHANVGAVGALSTLPSTLFICDKLCHASIIDGTLMARAEVKRFPHNDINRLETIIIKNKENYRHLVVVVESIYSMDGDAAPLRELVELRKKYPEIILYIDEAHAFGVKGQRGLGLAEELGVIDDIDVLNGTFGKAAASMGAFAAVSEEMKSLFINSARSFIFSTALPPVNIAWTLMMVEKITGMTEERRKLSSLSEEFSRRIEGITGNPTGSSSQIIPFMTGDASRALKIAGKAREAGFIALPIRRPTVPPGGERIRFSLGANMDMQNILPLFDILKSF